MILAVYHSKGGVGKTAGAVNLAWLAAEDGYRTLLVDLDPQGATSYYLRIKPRFKPGVKGLIGKGDDLVDHVKASNYRLLDVLPADPSFRHFDIRAEEKKKSARRLEKGLGDLAAQYDYVILDCPPSLSTLSENVFAFADHLLIPTVPTTLSLRSLAQVLKLLRTSGRSDASVMVYLSMVDRRKAMHRRLGDDLRELLAARGLGRMLEPAIPYSSDVEKMGVHREPVGVSAPSSVAARAFGELWGAVKSTINGEDRK